MQCLKGCCELCVSLYLMQHCSWDNAAARERRESCVGHPPACPAGENGGAEPFCWRASRAPEHSPLPCSVCGACVGFSGAAALAHAVKGDAIMRPHNAPQALIPHATDHMPILIAPFALMRVA